MHFPLLPRLATLSASRSESNLGKSYQHTFLTWLNNVMTVGSIFPPSVDWDTLMHGGGVVDWA